MKDSSRQFAWLPQGWITEGKARISVLLEASSELAGLQSGSLWPLPGSPAQGTCHSKTPSAVLWRFCVCSCPPCVQEGVLWCNSASNIRVFVTLKHNFCSYCLVPQSCPTFCDSMDGSLLGSSVHGIAQTRILEWETISSSGDPPDPGIEPTSPALAGRFFTTEPPGKPETQHTWFFSCSLRKIYLFLLSHGAMYRVGQNVHSVSPNFLWKNWNELLGQPNK